MLLFVATAAAAVGTGVDGIAVAVGTGVDGIAAAVAAAVACCLLLVDTATAAERSEWFLLAHPTTNGGMQN